MEIKRSIARGWGKGELYDVLVDLQHGMLPISGKTYYVSPQGNNTDGSTWAKAYTTIAAAISASNAYIALNENVGGRNRMYIDSNGGGNWEEALTVFPNQCDMIGVGCKGGWMVTILAARFNIGTAVTGCHIYNMRFISSAASIPVVKIPDGSHGMEFHRCMFDGSGGATPTIGLQLGSIADFKVNECKFVGNPLCITGIQMDGPYALRGEITGNLINAKTYGITLAHGSIASYQMLIKDNIIVKNDPTEEDQMTYGIACYEGNAQVYIAIIHNWIDAEDAIYFAGDVGSRGKWMCIDNHTVAGATGVIETAES